MKLNILIVYFISLLCGLKLSASRNFHIMNNNILIKRVYDEYSENDGYRILIDRLWPRGISKENAHLDEWMKTVSPSDELRKWFNHEPEKFNVFSEKYIEELKDKNEEINHLLALSKKGKITMLYAAKDKSYNNAVVLLNILNNV